MAKVYFTKDFNLKSLRHGGATPVSRGGQKNIQPKGKKGKGKGGEPNYQNWNAIGQKNFQVAFASSSFATMGSQEGEAYGVVTVPVAQPAVGPRPKP